MMWGTKRGPKMQRLVHLVWPCVSKRHMSFSSLFSLWAHSLVPTYRSSPDPKSHRYSRSWLCIWSTYCTSLLSIPYYRSGTTCSSPFPSLKWACSGSRLMPRQNGRFFQSLYRIWERWLFCPNNLQTSLNAQTFELSQSPFHSLIHKI